MMEKPRHCGKDYWTAACFDPKIYLEQCYPDVEGGDPYKDLLRDINRLWTDTFASGQIKGQRLLEFGCGPSINTVIPSSRCFDEIYMCEYAPQNRQAVQDWIDKKPYAHDWTSYFKFEAEQEGGTTYQDVKARVRQKIKKIIPCDLHKDNIFDPNQFEPEFFDCVTSSLCLEAACATDADYKTAVLKLSSFLKPGGHIIMAGVLHQTYYPVGDQLFYSLGIRPELLKDALEGAGFGNIKLDKLAVALPDVVTDCAGFFFVKAIKK